MAKEGTYTALPPVMCHIKAVKFIMPHGCHGFFSAELITCVDDGGPRLDIDAGSSLPGPEDPHERLSGEDASCFAHL